MLRFAAAAALCMFPAHLASAPCTAKMLDKMNSSLYWVVAYPDRDPNAELPSLNTRVTPKYSQAACDAQWTGVIAARIAIGESGAPDNVTVTGDPGFGMGESVRQIVQAWRFAPAMRDNHPIRSESMVEFGFGFGTRHISPPSPVLKYDPALPAEKPARGKQGPLVVSVVVDEQGLPRNIRVARSIGNDWDEAGVAAVRNWRFTPATLDGRPVAAEASIVLSFGR
jgi:TonB family protein